MKKAIKKILRIIFLFVGFFSEKKKIKNIYYHDVVLKEGYSYQKIEIEKFKRQMKFLVENKYKALSFEEANDWESSPPSSNEKPILITFDDGWISNYTLVFPLMKVLNLKFNIFLEIGKIDNDKNYLTWNMIKEMSESGLVCYGAHTFNHIDARKLNNSNIDIEIHEANYIMNNKIGIKVKDFCFPYGYYNKESLEILSDLNVYDRVYTSDGRKPTEINNMKVIGRIGIENEDTDKMFISKLKGHFDQLYFFTRSLKEILNKNHLI